MKTVKGDLLYFNTVDAKPLANGDQKYAEKALMIIDQLHALMKNNSVKLYPKFISTVELKFLGNNVAHYIRGSLAFCSCIFRVFFKQIFWNRL